MHEGFDLVPSTIKSFRVLPACSEPGSFSPRHPPCWHYCQQDGPNMAPSTVIHVLVAILAQAIPPSRVYWLPRKIDFPPTRTCFQTRAIHHMVIALYLVVTMRSSPEQSRCCVVSPRQAFLRSSWLCPRRWIQYIFMTFRVSHK